MATVNFVQQIYSREVLQAFVQNLAPLRGFSIDASPAPAEQGTVVKMSLISNATSDTDNTNFEVDGGTLNEIDVTLGTYRKTSLSVSDQQLVETMGASLLQLNNAYQAGARLATDVWSDITAAITPLAFPATPFKVAANGAFTPDDVSALLADAYGPTLKFPKKGVSLYLTAQAFYALVGKLSYITYGDQSAIRFGRIDGLFGLDSVYWSNVMPIAAAAPAIVGFLATPAAFGVCFRHIPAPYPQEYIAVDELSDEEGLTIGYRRHYARKLRKTFDVWDTLYGFQKGDPEALLLITNQT